MGLTKCDGTCEKVSPDAKDRHIANSWTTVEVTDRHGRYPRKRYYIFCDDCYSDIKEAICKK